MSKTCVARISQKRTALFLVAVGLFTGVFTLSGCSIKGSIDDLGSSNEVASKKTVSFDRSGVTLTEGGSATVNVVLNRIYTDDTTLSVLLIDPTNRFVSVPVLITIPAGSQSTSLLLQTMDDNLYEGVQDYVLSLASSDTSVNTVPATLNITLNDNDSPVQKLFSQIAAGRSFTCGLATDGDAYCFGDRTYGVLGDGTMNEAYSPSPILTSNMVNKKFLKVSIGYLSSCGVAMDGVPYCWGSNGGPMGTGYTETLNIPTAVDTSGIPGQKTFIDISVYYDHACGITSDNLLYCWGGNGAGQLGIGSSTASLVPVAVNVSALAVADRTFSKVTTGTQFTCALTVTKKAYCWGLGTGGALGNNAAANSNLPVAVNTSGITGSTNFASLYSADSHSCAIMDDNATYCWGAGSHGRLGYGGTTQKNLPFAPDTNAIGGFTNFKSLSLGDSHTCGITNLDTLYCWGSNSSGQIGNAATTDALTPTAVAFGATTTVKLVSAGSTSTCAQKTDNGIYCWGDGTYGQLGNGVSTAITSSPIAATATSGLDLANISSFTGNEGFCVRNALGDMRCWGASEYQQLGNNANASGPVKVNTSNLTGTKKFTKLSAGYYHVCGIGTDAQIYCWGGGYNGQVGVGSNGEFSKPVAVDTSSLPAGLTFTDIRAGYYHACAIASNSNMYCWGYNGDGELGNNSTTDSGVPVLVDTTDMTGSKIFSSFDTAKFHSCGIATDQTAYCWGWGSDRALGNGGTARKLRPYPVNTAGIAGSKSFTQISTGARSTCAVMADGEAYCWGTSNPVMATAAGTTTANPSKLLKTNIVSGSTTISSIGVGEAHGCFMTSDFGIYCFGYNAVGQLGNGTTTNSVLAINVTSSFPAAANIHISRAHSTFVLGNDQKIYGVGWGLSGQLGALIKRDTTTVVTPTAVY
jgi:alpha-tubulin suppressor-like RCC1 family protein